MRPYSCNTTKETNAFLEGTPYWGGYFKVKFKFTEEFPAAPPKCTSNFSRPTAKFQNDRRDSVFRLVCHQDLSSECGGQR